MRSKEWNGKDGMDGMGEKGWNLGRSEGAAAATSANNGYLKHSLKRLKLLKAFLLVLHHYSLQQLLLLKFLQLIIALFFAQ